MCEDQQRLHPAVNARRAAQLQQLVTELHLDGVLLVTGFDGSYSLESKASGERVVCAPSWQRTRSAAARAAHTPPVCAIRACRRCCWCC
jgi:hypothetical protein